MMSYDIKSVREVTLSEILDAREKRYELQRKLLSTHKTTLIFFTMNIAGPIKNSPAIDRAYRYGLLELLRSLPEEKIVAKYTESDHCGPLAIIAVDLDAKSAKDICISIEEGSRIGRLFDMDVLDSEGKKLDRSNPRACIVCGKIGRECAAGRLHPVEEITAVTKKIISEHFGELDAKYIGKIAAESLVKEVETTPKPGLVDLENNGSHTDMSVTTFRKSAAALRPYFAECFSIGIQTKNASADEAFSRLREAGLVAEKTMYEATNGVNTHKGLIYSLGVLIGAAGRLWTVENPFADATSIVKTAADLVRKSSLNDLESASGNTAGERLYISKGLTGIRGEVASGFPSVMGVALPTYEAALTNGLSENDAGVRALLSLIATIEDTNVYHRGGDDGADYAKAYAKKLLAVDYDKSRVAEMDREFIKRRLSPGGAADLLAITFFLHTLKTSAR